MPTLVEGKNLDVYLETERLVLRRFTADDVESLFELDCDPEVVRFANMEVRPRPTKRSADACCHVSCLIMREARAMVTGRL